MKNKRAFLVKIIMSAILVALNIILERLVPSYQVWNQNISIGFITIAFAAAFLGVPYAVLVAGLGDFLGAIIMPFGPYFVGYTLTNCIYGLILGVFIHKNAAWFKIVLAVLLNKIVCTLTLNTLWTALLYKGGIEHFWAVGITRIPQAVIMTVVETVVLMLVFWRKSQIRQTLDKSLNALQE